MPSKPAKFVPGVRIDWPAHIATPGPDGFWPVEFTSKPGRLETRRIGGPSFVSYWHSDPPHPSIDAERIADLRRDATMGAMPVPGVIRDGFWSMERP